MRKNKSSLLLQTRVLHLENLEKREMLSVSPLDAAAAQETAAVVAESSVVETIPVVLVESSESETSGVRFEAGEISGRFNATWDAVEGYETYHVKVSRDGGATWSTYRKGVEGTTVETRGCTTAAITRSACTAKTRRVLPLPRRWSKRRSLRSALPRT